MTSTATMKGGRDNNELRKISRLSNLELNTKIDAMLDERLGRTPATMPQEQLEARMQLYAETILRRGQR